MEAAIRHLRDGALSDAPACAICCVIDQLNVIGGAVVLQYAVQSLLAAMRQGRSQATSLRLVDLTGTLSSVAGAAAIDTAGAVMIRRSVAVNVEVIDLFSDPWGWRAAMALEHNRSSPAATATSETPNHGPTTSLDTLCQTLLRPAPGQPSGGADAPMVDARPGLAISGGDTGGGRDEGDEGAAGAARDINGGDDAGTTGRSVCVVISCLSTLMERYGEMQALSLVEAVQRSPGVSCVLTSLHKDLHPDRVLFGVRRLCSCTLELSPLTALQTEVAQRVVAGGPGGGSGGGGSGGGGAGAGLGAGWALAGRLDCRTKRRTGRVKVDSELYSIRLHDGSSVPPPESLSASASAPAPARVHFFPAPPFLDAPDPRALVRLQPKPAAAATPAAGAAAPGAGGPAVGPAAAAKAEGGVAPPASGPTGGGQGMGLLSGVATAKELARAVGSSMRLTLTEEERRAKERVVLPYQHTGRHQRGGAVADAYMAGDHRAYLPPAAGGSGPAAGGSGQQALGHILYVRDSGSEADSDQELDEDLDI